MYFNPWTLPAGCLQFGHNSPLSHGAHGAPFSMLAVTNLACVRGDRRLFSGLDFSLEAGGYLHVRGENGAGKTSLLRMLCGLSPAAEGEIRWQGRPIGELDEAFRQVVLYFGHHNALKDDLTPLENLRLAAAFHGQWLGETQAFDLLQRAGLRGREDLPVRVLSQGQKRRTALARLLCSRARLWILDEPFVALDVAAVDWLAGIIAAHVGNGGCVVLTSHQEVLIPGTSGQSLNLS